MGFGTPHMSAGILSKMAISKVGKIRIRFRHIRSTASPAAPPRLSLFEYDRCVLIADPAVEKAQDANPALSFYTERQQKHWASDAVKYSDEERLDAPSVSNRVAPHL